MEYPLRFSIAYLDIPLCNLSNSTYMLTQKNDLNRKQWIHRDCLRSFLSRLQIKLKHYLCLKAASVTREKGVNFPQHGRTCRRCPLKTQHQIYITMKAPEAVRGRTGQNKATGGVERFHNPFHFLSPSILPIVNFTRLLILVKFYLNLRA